MSVMWGPGEIHTAGARTPSLILPLALLLCVLCSAAKEAGGQGQGPSTALETLEHGQRKITESMRLIEID